MKLYIGLKEMTFDDGIEYKIINEISVKEFPCYDIAIDIADDDKFIQDTMQIEYKKDKDGNETDEIKLIWFVTKEQETWYNFPLYQIKDGKIKDFDYTKHQYFANAKRREAITTKIGRAYNSPTETKILRKTLKYIMDTLEIPYPDFFKKYNDKVEGLITKNPKSL